MPGLIDLVPVVRRLAKAHTAEEIFIDHVHAAPLLHQAIAREICAAASPWLDTRQPPQSP
jgi:hypothetical protein